MNLFLTQEFLTGGKHHRFKRGYKNVIDEAIRLVRFNLDDFMLTNVSFMKITIDKK